MLGVTLLIFLMLAYLLKKNTLWVVLFFSCLLNGFGVLTHERLGIYPPDIALFFTFFTFAVDKHLWRKDTYIGYFSKAIMLIECLVIIVFVYDVLSIGISIYDAIAGVRPYLILISYFVLKRVSLKDFENAFTWIFILTFLSCIPFIIEGITGHYIFSTEIDNLEVDNEIGIARSRHTPVLLNLVLIVAFSSVIAALKQWQYLGRIMFPISIIFDQARSGMAASLFSLMLLFYKRGSIKKNLFGILIVGIVVALFWVQISTRFVKNDDRGFSTLQELAFIDLTESNYDIQGKGSLIYRLAWVQERAEYCLSNGFLTTCIGLGQMPEREAQKRYSFSVSLHNYETDENSQLYTADITWGKILCDWGFVGGLFWLYLWWILIKAFYKNREKSSFCMALYCYFIMSIFYSFYQSNWSNPQFFIFYIFVAEFVLNYIPYQPTTKQRRQVHQTIWSQLAN